MSYAMTHLLIADNYIERHSFDPEEQALFLIASISPDSVHARPDYDPHMKERSHFLPAGIAWGTVYQEEPMNRMYAAAAEFYRSRRRMGNPSKGLDKMELAFLKGYTMHLLVDIFNCKLVYAPNLIRFGPDLERFRVDYRKQCMNFDNHLYWQLERSAELFQAMERGLELLKSNPILEGLGLKGRINVEEIGRFFDDTKQIYKQSYPVTPEDMYMITEDSSKGFIDDVGRQCGELLFDFPVREGLFRVECGGFSL